MKIAIFGAHLLFVSSLLSPPQAFAQVPIREDILEAIVFLYPYRVVDGELTAGAGTGFVVMNENRQSFMVTAKHVLKQKSGDYYPKLCIRNPTKAGGADFLTVALTGDGAARVLTHPTESDVDIAAIPAMDVSLPRGKPVEHWLGTSLGTSLFAKKDHFSKGYVRLGDEVFFTGWFSSYFGRARNYPIVRFGRLSLLSDERIPWSEGGENKMLHLYLVEAWATPGNSGAPVFFRPTLQREPGTFVLGTPPLLLAGVLKGFFGARPLINSGIAAVVPIFELDTILSSDTATQLKPLRRRIPPEAKEIELCREAEKLFLARQGSPTLDQPLQVELR